MLNKWFDKISAALDPNATESSVTTLDIERVSAILLVEIARTDHEIEASEREAIEKALAQAGNLSPDELKSVVDDAFNEADGAMSLYEHVQLINDHFDRRSKLALVEQMWRVALADGNIDGYEEYTIRKLCDLLFIKHRDFMQAKLKVIDG